jgi:hypothetical protein
MVDSDGCECRGGSQRVRVGGAAADLSVFAGEADDGVVVEAHPFRWGDASVASWYFFPG